MTYKMMNWELEAARVGAAFGIIFPCWFVRYGDANKTYQLITTKSGEWHELAGQEEIQLKIYYTKDVKNYWLKDSSGQSLVHFDHENRFTNSPRSLPPQHLKLFVRALFNLDLLTAPIEKWLNVNITAHEKLEWAFEYNERIKL